MVDDKGILRSNGAGKFEKNYVNESVHDVPISEKIMFKISKNSKTGLYKLFFIVFYVSFYYLIHKKNMFQTNVHRFIHLF